MELEELKRHTEPVSYTHLDVYKRQTFNHLHTSGKQIIISSDKPPKDIETLEARLRTRFEWGLIADISSPNYETRMAILQKKIELDHLEKYNIPNDVLEYIATNVKTNIRELEGSLNKLIALYKLNNNESIDIALAAEALKDIISSDNKREVTPVSYTHLDVYKRQLYLCTLSVISTQIYQQHRDISRRHTGNA